MADEPKHYRIREVAKLLGLPEKRVRAYYRVGIFPMPIREPGETGGFWLQEEVEWMQRRRLMVHRFRVLPAVKQRLEELIPPKRGCKRQRKQPKTPDS